MWDFFISVSFVVSGQVGACLGQIGQVPIESD